MSNDYMNLVKFLILLIIIIGLWVFIHFKICVKYNQKSIFDDPNKEDDDDNNVILNRTFNIYDDNRLISEV
jgi:nitric oxide reductase large subunit